MNKIKNVKTLTCSLLDVQVRIRVTVTKATKTGDKHSIKVSMSLLYFHIPKH